MVIKVVKVLENGMYIFQNKTTWGEVRYVLGSNQAESFCNGDECQPFGINQDVYRVFLESRGGESFYYSEYGEEIDLGEYNFQEEMGTCILCDTYFKSIEAAEAAAESLHSIFLEQGSNGLIKAANSFVEELWHRFGAVIVNEEERIESSFREWVAGTNRHEIWKWFDRSHTDGLVKGLMNWN